MASRRKPGQYREVARNPYRHAGLEARGIALRIESQAQRAAVVIADDPLGLPGGKDAERLHLGDDRLDRVGSAASCDIDRAADRKAAEFVLACVE